MQTISLPLSPPCQSNSLILANDEMKKKKKKKEKETGKDCYPRSAFAEHFKAS